MSAQRIDIDVDAAQRVSGLLEVPGATRACYVMAHGAGAGMTHPSLASFAVALAERGIATLRYQFPYMENESKRPDPPRVAHAAVRAAVTAAHRALPELPLFAGGRSFGGRMTSQAQAAAPLPHVAGLVFLGFPLHPAGKPADDRGEHLSRVTIPMLFLSGTRDALAQLRLLEPLVARLGPRATLRLLDEADHAFHVPARTGRNDAQVRAEAADAMAGWISTVA
jgi:predicted alpha/beta-hydrolase family hydrolase